MVRAQLPQVMPSTVQENCIIGSGTRGFLSDIAECGSLFIRTKEQHRYIRIMPQGPLQISYSLADIRAAAHQLWQWAHPLRVFTFSGSLGAGKTTFIHALCDDLGVKDAVSSPTFALINEYRFTSDGKEQTIYHMDWYRLRDADEAVDAGMEDSLNDPAAYCFIEWPEKAPEIMPRLYVEIKLEVIDDLHRLLTATLIEKS